MWKPIGKACLECASCLTIVATVDLWDGVDSDIYWSRFQKYSAPLVEQSGSLEQELSTVLKKIDKRFNEGVNSVLRKENPKRLSTKSFKEFIGNIVPDNMMDDEAEFDHQMAAESVFMEKYRTVSKEEESQMSTFTPASKQDTSNPLIAILNLMVEKDIKEDKLREKFDKN